MPRGISSLILILALGLADAAMAADGQALLAALQQGDVARARELTAQHADVNARDETGATPLIWAAQRHAADLADDLLEAGADPNLLTANGLGPLQVAIGNQEPKIALLLLAHGANPNAAREDGESALMTAARAGEADVMAALIAHGANVNAQETEFHQTALMWSAGHPDQVRLLIKSGADINARTKIWDVTATIYTPVVATLGVTGIPWNHKGEYTSKQGGQTALAFAVQKDDLNSVAALLDAGIDVNDSAADGTTGLLLSLYKWNTIGEGTERPEDARAVAAPNIRMANFLLDRGARVSVANAAGYTPLHAAVLAMVELKRRSRTPDEDTVKLAGAAPIDGAESLRLVARMLDLKANPNAATRFPTQGPIGIVRLNPAPSGSSPLHIAARAGNAELVALLLKHRANPNLIRQDGHSPLTVATMADDLPSVSMLVKYGADVKRSYDPIDSIPDPVKSEARPRSRQSIMHIAAVAGAFKVVDYLARHGAPLTLKNDKGETPLMLADAHEVFEFNRAKETAGMGTNAPPPSKPVIRSTETSDAIRKVLPHTTGL